MNTQLPADGDERLITGRRLTWSCWCRPAAASRPRPPPGLSRRRPQRRAAASSCAPTPPAKSRVRAVGAHQSAPPPWPPFWPALAASRVQGGTHLLLLPGLCPPPAGGAWPPPAPSDPSPCSRVPRSSAMPMGGHMASAPSASSDPSRPPAVTVSASEPGAPPLPPPSHCTHTRTSTGGARARLPVRESHVRGALLTAHAFRSSFGAEAKACERCGRCACGIASGRKAARPRAYLVVVSRLRLGPQRLQLPHLWQADDAHRQGAPCMRAPSTRAQGAGQPALIEREPGGTGKLQERPVGSSEGAPPPHLARPSGRPTRPAC